VSDRSESENPVIPSPEPHAHRPPVRVEGLVLHEAGADRDQPAEQHLAADRVAVGRLLAAIEVGRVESVKRRLRSRWKRV